MESSLTEQQVNERVESIIEEYAQLPQMSNCDLSIEAIDLSGDVNVTITGLTKIGLRRTAQKTIKYDESLSFISDTFSYPDYIGRLSKNINSESVKMAYFDPDGYLIVFKDDNHFGCTERFKIKEKHRDIINVKLQNNLGKKLKFNET